MLTRCVLRVGTALAATLVVVSGCGSGSAPAVPTAAPSGAGTKLAITVDSGKKARSFTLTCDPPGGTHPAAGAACDYLAAAGADDRDPFAVVPPDQPCTMIYGGPETATVTGTWAGTAVDAEFARTNGCEIARWADAVPLLLYDPDATTPSRSPRPR